MKKSKQRLLRNFESYVEKTYGKKHKPEPRLKFDLMLAYAAGTLDGLCEVMRGQSVAQFKARGRLEKPAPLAREVEEVIKEFAEEALRQFCKPTPRGWLKKEAKK